MRRTTLCALSVLVAVVLSNLTAQPASATTWTVWLAPGARGQSAARPAPVAPGKPAASCVSSLGNTVKLTWTTVANATNYTVTQSTGTSSGPYALVATVSGTSWTSGGLANGSYWFQVTARVGANWTSPASAASSKRTITLGSLCS